MTNREIAEKVVAAAWDSAMEQMVDMDWDFAKSCYPENASKVLDAAEAALREAGVGETDSTSQIVNAICRVEAAIIEQGINIWTELNKRNA